MERALKLVAGSLPLIFAFAFLVPLMDQVMRVAGITAPLGLSSLTLALIIGGAWGLFTQVTGRWI